MVPKEWVTKDLRSISLLITKGSTPTTYGHEFVEQSENSIRFVGAYNCSFDGKFKSDSEKWISKEADELLKRSKLNDKDCIICIVGNTIGSNFLVSKEIIPANINQNVAIIRADEGKVNSRYLHYWIMSQYIQDQVQQEASTQAQPSLSLKQVGDFTIALPPLNEQNRIAKILSTWDKAINTTEQLLANSQQQKKALMQQLLTGKKRLLDNNGVRFSGEWKKSTLGNLGNTFNGLTGKTKDDFGFGKKYIPYINIFKNSRIDLEALDLVDVKEGESQSLTQFGDIFFTTSSETPDEVGMSSVLLDQADEVYLNSFCFGFRLFDFKSLLPEFARYLLRSENIRSEIAVLGQGATRYNLSKKQLMKLELVLPNINEQKKIATILSTADQEIAALQQKLDALKLEKKALMQQLLTGKRRVKIN
ncbi:MULTISPECIES: restriction endonuclease subunit S [unclassified Aeromonas]|uniref:restriction endonuclease subunit S n=1 Tax=unclassified Aeromonas TaxID=257493 RepID=UPI003528F784